MKFVHIAEPGGPDVLQVVTGEIPAIGDLDVLIKVMAAGVNRPDLLLREGKYPMPKGVTQVPGLEVAGVVAEVGSAVDSFKVGDKVCALTNGGGYAEYCSVPATQTLPIPDNLSFVEAAAVPETFFTVWANLFMMGRATRGESLLIHGGASGIGTTAISLCNELGIKVYATAGELEKVQGLPATFIDYKTQDFAEEVLKLTSGDGVDIVFDIVGAPYFHKNLSLLKLDGRLLLVGTLGGNIVNDVNLLGVMLKRITITGSTMRARTSEEKRTIAQSLQENVWPLLADGKCTPRIYASYPMGEVAKAHACLDSGKHVGKVVLTMQ